MKIVNQLLKANAVCFQELHVKVIISKDGTAKVNGLFGETDGFSFSSNKSPSDLF